MSSPAKASAWAAAGARKRSTLVAVCELTHPEAIDITAIAEYDLKKLSGDFAMTTHLTAEFLNSILDADTSSGKLWWKQREKFMFRDFKGYQASYCSSWNARYAGKEAFNRPNGHGYLYGTILGKNYMSHRVLWTIHYGTWPSIDIDHINRLSTDNKISNLRLALPAQNMANTGAKKNGACPYKGVSFHISNKKWIANIRHNGKRLHLGYFDTAEAAAAAYDKAAKQIHGDYALMNFSDESLLAI